MDTKRQRTKYAALLILGGVLGAGLALETARTLQIKFSQEALLRYAQGILRIEEQSAQEISAASAQFNGDKPSFCSDEEIGAMRRFVYNAMFVKDIGRIKDGFVYCISSVGRLETRVHLPAATISFTRPDNGKRLAISPSNKLLLAPDSIGVILVSDDVSVVLNPAFYAQFDNPPIRAAWLVRDPEHGTVGYIFGAPEPLPAAEVMAGKLVEHGGIVYQPLCSQVRLTCVVAAESRADMLAQRPGYYVSFPVTASIFSGLGALFGFSVASSILLLYHRQRSFEHRLRRAVRQRKITCAYQPIVDLESGEMIAAEALARWTNEMGEAVPPDVFIATAEERGFLGEITSLVLERVLADLARPLKAGFHVTINISASDLMDERFITRLEQRLEEAEVPPGAVGFEITEHSTALKEEAKAAIARLREAGHTVYLDDFGTGYSSLAYLHDLHADAIKMDRVFTHTVGTEAVTASVVPQILDMARRLGLKVIVEGIETEEQAAYFRVRYQGVLGQGWLFGRPGPAEELIAVLGARAGAGNRSARTQHAERSGSAGR